MLCDIKRMRSRFIKKKKFYGKLKKKKKWINKQELT